MNYQLKIKRTPKSGINAYNTCMHACMHIFTQFACM